MSHSVAAGLIFSGAPRDRTPPEIALDQRISEPFTNSFKSGEGVFDLLKGSRALAVRQILKQFRRPGGVVAAPARSHNTAHNLTIQNEIIGTRGKLDQAVGHKKMKTIVAVGLCRGSRSRPVHR